MNAAVFCRELAVRLNKEPNAILIFDRTLAEAGFRRKARGRHAPDLSTEEAVLLLLAFMSGHPATEAHNAASDLARFKMVPGAGEQPMAAFHHTFGLDSNLGELSKKPLLDLLTILCTRMASDALGRDNFVYLEVTDGAIVELQFDMNWQPSDRTKRLALRGEVSFSGATNSSGNGFHYVTHTATPALLKWIGEVTAANG
ncbi:hypothetical protein AncyloWKF20_09490 [Ancylobacter sp. WKF20]|uniref:hypothetical protein n=1 Tax=Ancylobacter sp. WKF20 TaxID=3039801 RepID=UPI0024340C59|nr:hypothetical protein [Ancylobacter sp. WKF20]WGD32025.1 hypothetical protein AncyloWKF20_09490 [Ancylobacter sp. WKF20]